MPTPKADKAEKTAKPRKAPAKKKTAASPEPVEIRPTHDQIAALAHKYWVERGHRHGDHHADWLRAEQELMKAS